MFVGDVLCAIIAIGCSWKLSGGIQFSSADTKFSKKPHVLRAILWRKSSSPSTNSGLSSFSGEFSRQEIAGAINHKTRMGHATKSPPGLIYNSVTINITANSGVIHIDLYADNISLPEFRDTDADGFQCNNFLPVTIIRQLVRITASVYLKASYGRTAIPNTKRINTSLNEVNISSRCTLTVISCGLLSNCQPVAAITGNKTIVVTVSVQNHGKGKTDQPNIKINISDSGKTLRRRLSRIFHRDNAERGFNVKPPLPRVTYGSIQAPICQSPRTHL